MRRADKNVDSGEHFVYPCLDVDGLGPMVCSPAVDLFPATIAEKRI